MISDRFEATRFSLPNTYKHFSPAASHVSSARARGQRRHVKLWRAAVVCHDKGSFLSSPGSIDLRALILDDQVGTLEPGKKADVIVLDAELSRDIENTRKINSVWKNGQKVSSGPRDHCN
jgi:hypothetical protein